MSRRVKEYALGGIYENLASPERYAFDRATGSRLNANPCVPCGAGVAANLVMAGLADWAGPNTWIVEWTPLGERIRELVHDR